MIFSPEWDARYSENTHLSVWPWSDLVSYFHRYAKPYSETTKVLEIGFGAGANIPFFRALKVDYSGVEGSSTIRETVARNYPELAEKLYVGDFLSYAFPEKYDIIVDRASMTHNSTMAIRQGLAHLADNLNSDGKYIGIDWFSTEHSDYLLGDMVDEFTRCSMAEGLLVGVGNVHFSSKEHILELFGEAGLSITKLELKKITSEMQSYGHQFASWNLVAKKV
jgi:hypothetical protein